jgi:hypothetical protein
VRLARETMEPRQTEFMSQGQYSCQRTDAAAGTARTPTTTYAGDSHGDLLSAQRIEATGTPLEFLEQARQQLDARRPRKAVKALSYVHSIPTSARTRETYQAVCDLAEEARQDPIGGGPGRASDRPVRARPVACSTIFKTCSAEG